MRRGFWAYKRFTIREVWKATKKSVRTYAGRQLVAIVAFALVASLFGDGWTASMQTGVLAAVAAAALMFVMTWLYYSFRVPYELYENVSEEVDELRGSIGPRVEIEGVNIHEAIFKGAEAEGPAKYVQLKVLNCGITSIVCKPFLIRVEKLNDDGVWELWPYDHVIELWWSIIGKHELELDCDIHRLVNVMNCSYAENRLRFDLGMAVPIPIHRYFNDCGRYRLTIRLAAKNLQTQEITLEVDNDSDWHSFSVAIVPTSAIQSGGG